MKKSYPEWLRGVVGNEAIERSKSTVQRRDIGRVKIGANVVASDFVTSKLATDLLDWDDPLRRNPSAVQPHRNHGLADRLAGQLTEPSGERNLSTSLGNSHLNEFDSRRLSAHLRPKNNTESVVDVNTRSANGIRQTRRMPKPANTTDFWKRLELARTTHKPPLTMNQTSLAKEYGAAWQSAVTKWKTGGPDGTSMPSPDTVRKMAIDADVCVDWLWSGRGDMRPLPATDELTSMLVSALNEIKDHEVKRLVVKEALKAIALHTDPVTSAKYARADEVAQEAVQKKSPNRSQASAKR